MPIPRGWKRRYSQPSTKPPAQANDDNWLELLLEESSAFTMNSSPGVFHASSLGEDARILFLKFEGLLQEQISGQTARRMRNGTAIHDRWKRELEKAGVLAASEKTLTFQSLLPLRGRLDFLVYRSYESQAPTLHLIELKSTNRERWESLKEPDFAALAQWAVYSEGEQVPRGFIVYEDTDTQRLKFFRVVWEGKTLQVFLHGKRVAEWPDLLKNLFDKLEYVLWCKHTGKLPEVCLECRMQGGCKHPTVCSEAEKQRPIVSFQEWKEKAWEKSTTESPSK